MIVKNEDERVKLREGGRRLATILQTLKNKVKAGVNAQELEDEAREMISEMGDTPAFLGYKPEGADRPFPAALCVSVNEEIVHGIPNEEPKIFAEGDLVTLDCGLIHEGFITDSAVSVSVGSHKENDRLIQAAEEALMAGIEKAHSGNTLGDVGHAIAQVAKQYGYHYPRELGGHGVGAKVHEAPFVANYGTPGKGDRLREGQVIAIEPMLSLGSGAVDLAPDGYAYYTRDGSKTAHVEHTVIVGKDVAEIITSHK